MRPIGTAVMVLMVFTGTGCAGTLNGQVVDAQTGQPIAGAIVVGVWTKVVGLGLTHHELVGVKETETDAEGRFTLDAPGQLGVDEQAITIYRFGYIAWSNLFIFPTDETRRDTHVPPRISLERFPPGQSHKRHIGFISFATRASMGYGLEKVPKFFAQYRRELELP